MSRKDDCYKLFKQGKENADIAKILGFPIGTVKKYSTEYKKDVETNKIRVAGLLEQNKTAEQIAEILGLPLDEVKTYKKVWCYPKYPKEEKVKAVEKVEDEIPFSDIGYKPTTEEIAKTIVEEVDMQKIAKQVKEESKPNLKTRTIIEGEKANFLIDSGQVRIYIGEHFIKVPADYYALFIQEAIEVNRKMVEGGLA